MSSAIMRFQKLHTSTEIGHALGHNKRLREVKNADTERGYLNTSETYVEDVKKHIKELDRLHRKTTGKRARKDAVRIIEVIMTSDKEFFDRVDDAEYFEACKEWLIDIFGEENLLTMDIHRDERTPHAHFLVTPIRDNQYSCKKIINGRNAVRGLQNSFYDAVKGFGLERGELVEYTNAKHKSSLEYAEDISKNKESVSQMTEQEKENYATFGAIAKEEIEDIKRENKEIKEKNEILKEESEYYREENEKLLTKYEGLRRGVLLATKGNKKMVEDMERQGVHLLKLEQENGKKVEKEHNEHYVAEEEREI